MDTTLRAIRCLAMVNALCSYSPAYHGEVSGSFLGRFTRHYGGQSGTGRGFSPSTPISYTSIIYNSQYLFINQSSTLAIDSNVK